MYIVQSGYAMVMGPPSQETNIRLVKLQLIRSFIDRVNFIIFRPILVTLGQGSVFGEIALLGVAGIGRRTADVVSQVKQNEDPKYDC